MKQILVLVVIVAIGGGGYYFFVLNKSPADLKKDIGEIAENVPIPGKDDPEKQNGNPEAAPSQATSVEIPFVRNSELATPEALAGKLIGFELLLPERTTVSALPAIEVAPGVFLDNSAILSEGTSGTGYFTLELGDPAQSDGGQTIQCQPVTMPEELRQALMSERWRGAAAINAAMGAAQRVGPGDCRKTLWVTEYLAQAKELNEVVIVEGTFHTYRRGKQQCTTTLKESPRTKFVLTRGNSHQALQAAADNKKRRIPVTLKLEINPTLTPKHYINIINQNLPIEDQYDHWVSVYNDKKDPFLFACLAQWAEIRKMEDRVQDALARAQQYVERSTIGEQFGPPTVLCRVFTADSVLETWQFEPVNPMKLDVPTQGGKGGAATQSMYIQPDPIVVRLQVTPDGAAVLGVAPG